jgi:hypothetical protein
VNAWQPFTFRGVAAFAAARWRCLLAVQVVTAAIFTGIFIWFLRSYYVPIITEVVTQIPSGATLSEGELKGIPEPVFVQNRFLAIVASSGPSTDFGETVDVQIEFRAGGFHVASIFRSVWGVIESGYSPWIQIDLGPANLQPWWGAWRPIILAAVAVATVINLFIAWSLLSLLYALPAKFIAWVADRQLTWRGAWKLCGAALIPGATLMTLGLALYGLGILDLIAFAAVFATHLVLGWVYVFFSPGFAPRLFPSLRQNPFSKPEQA